MKRLLRNSKLILASLVLAVGGLSVAATAAPAAHAAAPPPSISTQIGTTYYSNGDWSASAHVQGQYFTPGGSVKVEVFNGSLTLVTSETVTASQLNCHQVGVRLVCSGTAGTIDTWLFLGYHPPVQTYHVIAYDYSTGQWSNWSAATL
jgi:hypothetical protein